MNTTKHAPMVKRAIAQGVDFLKDFHAQNNAGYICAELAKEAGYRKPKNANGSTGRYYFYLLKRIHDGQGEAK